MIKTFRDKALADFWAGRRTKIDARLHRRISRCLQRLDQADKPEALNVAGYNFHQLQGKPRRYTCHIDGPWCVTFAFEDGDAYDVDFEQYQ